MTAEPDAPKNQDEILELATLEELLGLDDGATGLLSEMAGLFREDAPLRIIQLKAACEGGDPHLAGEAAHALKGAAGTLGAVELRTLAGEAERLARQGETAAISALIPSLERSYPRFVDALDGFIQAQG